jgi:lactoylglutathione lyase
MQRETMMSENVREVVPFLAVADMERSVRFYVDGLGFEMPLKWIVDGKVRWCRLQMGGAGLMLQEFRTEGHVSWNPEGKVGEGVTLYFMCEDALAIYRQVIARGLEASSPFVGNGMWVTFLTDPDGYRLAFESNTDVPEDTDYSSWLAAGKSEN